MTDLVVYHHTRCSKSRSAVSLLEEKQVPFTLRLYVQEPLSRKELTALLQKLNLPASALLRKKDPLYRELFGGKSLSEEESLEALLAYPLLMERPVVARGQEAIVARPPEKILEFLQGE